VMWIHGPGGIGKSALLDQFADDARAAGRTVIRVDGRDVGSAEEAFAAAVSGAAGIPGVVVLADTFEQCGELEAWLRQDFAPGLPEDAVLVVASRRPPGPDWRLALAWSEMLQVIALGYLPSPDAAALLEARHVSPELRAPLLAFARGHPLALSLAAQTAGLDALASTEWMPDGDVLRKLMSGFIGSVPSEAHRLVLHICAHAYETSEEMLRAVLGPRHDVHAMFEWLCDQPFIEFGPSGVFPHEVIRDALDADLRWRDPQGYEVVHRGIRRYLLERIKNTPGQQGMPAITSLSFLHRHGGVMPDYVTWQRRREIHEDDFVPEDEPAVLSLAAAAEGQESARIVGFWLSRQPSAFRVYRRVGSREPVGFMAWIELTDPAAEDARADPVMAAAMDHSRSARPLRAGEHLAVARFAVSEIAYRRPSEVTDLVRMRILSQWLRATGLAWSYLVVPDPEFRQPLMDYLDQHRIPAAPAVGGRTYAIYAHDWREVPLETWLDRHVDQELFGIRNRPSAPEAPGLAVLSREAFDAAVRGVLRSWHRPDQIAASPLARTGLAVDAGLEPVAALRHVVTEAAGQLAADPRTEQLHRAIEVAFFRGSPTQEQAAERLGLPLSTYRRHLARGQDQISDLLWSWEIFGRQMSAE
jgi:hypothetical protein